MIRRFLVDWPWKVLSLFAATLIWLAVSSEPEMATVLRVPVQYKNMPAKLEISSQIEGSVRLELSGVKGMLKTLSTSPSPVVLDFSSVRAPGVRTFNIDGSTVDLPKGVQLVNAVPGELRFTFEREARKFVPVKVSLSGQVPDGAQVAQVIVDPSQLEVVGPQGHVNLVNALVTDPIDLATIKSDTPVTTSPYISEPLVRFVNFQTVTVRVILKN